VFKIKIAISLDGTLFPTYEILSEMFFRQFGEDIDWYKFDFEKQEYLSTKKGEWLKGKLNDRRFYRILNIRPDVKEAIDLIVKRNDELIYTTTRPNLFHKETIKSLRRNLLPHKSGLIHYFNKNRAPSTELKVFKKKGINVVIENDTRIVSNIARSRLCKVLLFDTYRNKGCHFGQRVSTWKEIRSILLERRY
jgi:uncharacterized HAD superfamily protein